MRPRFYDYSKDICNEHKLATKKYLLTPKQDKSLKSRSPLEIRNTQSNHFICNRNIFIGINRDRGDFHSYLKEVT